MSKFISVKVFRGTFPEDEKVGRFAGQPGACFRVATDDEADVKCYHVSEPPFDVKDLDNADHVKSFILVSLKLNPFTGAEVELLGAELVAEYKMTEGVTGGIDIERIK
ncbi:hypothetical protein NPJ41_000124 [Escherichia coli]|nr:hypothetical protein [Escherichia coli]EJN1873144.1 hypothetical protein [Escherichia coli]